MPNRAELARHSCYLFHGVNHSKLCRTNQRNHHHHRVTVIKSLLQSLSQMIDIKPPCGVQMHKLHGLITKTKKLRSLGPRVMFMAWNKHHRMPDHHAKLLIKPASEGQETNLLKIPAINAFRPHLIAIRHIP